MKRTTLILMFLLPLCLSAKVWTPKEVPMVFLEDSTHHVCNPDNILQERTVWVCDSLISVIERVTGIQFVVVCVENLEGDDPYAFNRELFELHGIGQANKDNGLLLTLATKDRSYFLSTGTGMEGILPDAICKRIENQVFVPHLKEEKWDLAIYQMVVWLHNYLLGDDTVRMELTQRLSQAEHAEETKDDKDNSNWLLWFMGILVAGGGAFFAWVNGLFDSKEEKERRRKAEKEQAEKLFNETHTDCPKCGGKQTFERIKFQFERGADTRLHKSSLWKCNACKHEELHPEDMSWIKGESSRPKAERLCPNCMTLALQKEVEKVDFMNKMGVAMSTITWKCDRCGRTDKEDIPQDDFYKKYIYTNYTYVRNSDGRYQQERLQTERDTDRSYSDSSSSSSRSSGGSFGGGSYGGGGAGGRF